MKAEEYEMRLLRARLFVACRNQRATAHECVGWAIYEASCDLDRDVRILCVQSVPIHLAAERVLPAAKETYEFARMGEEKDPENRTPKVRPGAQPGRQAGSRSPQRA